jgi:glutathione S-transferase
MALKIYGNMHSSAFRCVWAAEELELKYELVHVSTDTCGENDLLFSLNPNRKIPAIDDDGFVLWESMAINHYLARKTGGTLAPANGAEDAKMQMWSFWVSGECLADCFAVLSHVALLQTADRSEVALQASTKRLAGPLKVLETHLESNRFLVGGRFTISDLNVASVLGWLAAARSDLSEYPRLSDWLHQASSRPAAKKCAAMAASG